VHGSAYQPGKLLARYEYQIRKNLPEPDQAAAVSATGVLAKRQARPDDVA